MILNITSSQFSFLKASLQSASGIILALDSPVTGTLTNSDVTLQFEYDGVDELSIEITAKHSFKAKIAPESVIESRIAAMFNDFIKKGANA